VQQNINQVNIRLPHILIKFIFPSQQTLKCALKNKTIKMHKELKNFPHCKHIENMFV